MCSLGTFQSPPEEGFITVGEQNGELLASRAGPRTLDTYMKILDSRPSYPKESARSAFLEHEDSLRQKVQRAWYEHGLTGALQEIAVVESDKDGGNGWVSTVASHLLGAVRWGNTLHGSLFPHLKMSAEQLIEEFSPNLNWYGSIIRCFAWHPHTTKYAVALRDDSIRVHTEGKTDIIPILKHKLQKAVADLAWRPYSASMLAVACQSCILVWHVDPNSLATRPSTSSVQILNHCSHAPITSLAWSPQGGVLISASPADTAMMVWNVATEMCVPVRRVGGGGVTSLRWTLDGSKLLATCPSRVFRVWESRNWTCEKWTHLLTRCQCACWSPDGSVLLFAQADEPTIYSLSFAKTFNESSPSIGGSKVAVSSIDVSSVELEDCERSVRVGGNVQAMEWDPTGSRLAVQFTNCPQIAVFQTQLQPSLEIIPCGFVQGEPDTVPHLISFQPNYKQGAQLTVVWSNGKIAFIPFHVVTDGIIPTQSQLEMQSSFNTHNPTTLYTDLLQ